MKPFELPFTAFHNHILDHIMPDLSGSGWKVLCVAIRQTFGWEDKSTQSGRKESDRISYSQFLEKTGIGSKSTLSRAIRECLDKKYLERRQIGKHPGTGQPIFTYCLNREYEIEIAGTETVPGAGTETVPGAGTETVPGAGTETVLTKETTSKEKGKKSSAQDAKKKPSGILPDTKASRMMFGRLQANARAAGRGKGPRSFKTLEQKQKFDKAVAKLNEQEYERALMTALKQGINDVRGVVNYIAKWNGNGPKGARHGQAYQQNRIAPGAVPRRVATAEEARGIV